MYARNNPLIYVDPDGEFVIGFISGFVRGLVQGKNPFKTGWQTGVNEMKIYAGLFASDKDKNFFGRAWETLSRFTWQLPQTVLGVGYATVSNWAWQVDRVQFYGGATVSSGNHWGQGGAVALGSFITGGQSLRADPNNVLFQHEYGHYRQSQRWGPIYLFGVGLPSIWSANKARNDPSHIHNNFWAEQNANKRGFEYFYRKYRDDLIWNNNSNRILDTDWVDAVRERYRQNTPSIPSGNGSFYNPIRTSPAAPNYFNGSFFHQGIGIDDDDDWRYRRGGNRTSNDRLRILLSL